MHSFISAETLFCFFFPPLGVHRGNQLLSQSGLTFVNIQCYNPIFYMNINLISCPHVPLFLFTGSCLSSVKLMFFSLVFFSVVFIFCFFNIFLFRFSIRLQLRTLMNGAMDILTFQDISLWQVCNCYLKTQVLKSKNHLKDVCFPERTNFHVLPYFSLLSLLLPSESSLLLNQQSA